MPEDGPTLLCVATQGPGSGDHARLMALLRSFDATDVAFDRGRKARSAARVVLAGLRRRPDLVVMEGTGLAGGAAVLALRLVAGIPYVVSSGDAVAPLVGSLARWAGPPAALYERLLCRRCAGFVGWSPYLVGRALTFGAPRAMTAANWATTAADPTAGTGRAAIRARLGIREGTIVFGIVGKLTWNRRRRYCYGRELVQAVVRSGRPDVAVVIVGDGDGRGALEADAGALAGRSVLFTGNVARGEVGGYLAAMDVASLPQSTDAVGAFRYTTKLSEYLAARIPVVTGQLPLAYDLDGGWLWRLPGDAPWDDRYVDALAALMDKVTPEEIGRRAAAIPTHLDVFDEARQRRALEAFLHDLVDAPRR